MNSFWFQEFACFFGSMLLLKEKTENTIIHICIIINMFDKIFLKQCIQEIKLFKKTPRRDKLLIFKKPIVSN
jgi:hypothetical protein